MYQIDNSTATTTKPTPGSAGPNVGGYFTSGDPSTSTPATIVDPDWLNMLQEELGAIAKAAGLTQDKANNAQILAALRAGLNYVADSSGTANVITLPYLPALGAYTDGQVVRFKAANANNGATTINVNGLGAVALNSPVGALQGGEIIDGAQYAAIYSSAAGNFVLVESSAGALAVNQGTKSNQAISLSGLFQLFNFNHSATSTSVSASFSFTPIQNGTLLINANFGSTGSSLAGVSTTGSGYSDIAGATNFGSSTVGSLNRAATVTKGTPVTYTISVTASASSTILLGGIALFLPTI